MPVMVALRGVLAIRQVPARFLRPPYPPSGKMPKGGYYFDAIVRQPPIDDDDLNVDRRDVVIQID